MSDQVAAPVDAPVSEPTGFEVDQSVVDEGQDDATLLQEAIAMANGKGKSGQPEAAPKTEAPKVEVPTEEAPVEATTEEPAKAAAPSSDEWEKFFARSKELETKEADFKERESRLSDFEKVVQERDFEKAIKLLGFENPVEFLHEIADHGSKPSKERSEILTVKKEIQALKEERDREVKARQELEQRTTREKAIASKKAEIAGFIEKHPELSKGLVTMPGSLDQVFNKIVTHYNDTAKKTGKGVELSVEEAARQVEKDWEEGVEAIAKNPKAQEVFKRLHGAVKAAPSKVRSSSPALQAAPAIPQSDEDLRSVRRGDKEMNEALAWMASRRTARRSS